MTYFGAGHRFEAEHGPNTPLDAAVILFNAIVEILVLADPVCTENLICVDEVRVSPKLAEWSGCCASFWPFLVSPFKSKSRLEAENAALQLIVLRCKKHDRPFFARSVS